MRLSTAIDRFLSGYFATCKRSPKTIQAYTIDLEQFSTFLGPRTRLEGVKPEALEDWAAELKEAEYASASIRRKFASLKVFFNYWIRRDVLHRSPAWKIRLDLAPERRLPKTLTLEEVNRLIAYAEAQVGELPKGDRDLGLAQFLALRDLSIVELLFATGIRIGELVGLRVCDYRTDEYTFLIEGKGSRQRFAQLPDRRSRIILARYIEARRLIETNNASLFLDSFCRSMSTHAAARALKKIAMNSIGKRVTPHSIRHTVASLLLKNGANLRAVQIFLGHSNITTTQRYVHLSRSEVSRTIEDFHPRCHGQ